MNACSCRGSEVRHSVSVGAGQQALSHPRCPARSVPLAREREMGGEGDRRDRRGRVRGRTRLPGPNGRGDRAVRGRCWLRVCPARLPFAGWPPASSSPGSRALYPRHPLRPLRPTLVAGPLLPPPHFGARTPVPTPSPRTSRSPCHGPTSWRVSPIGERGLGGDGQGTGVRTPKTYCSPHTPAWGPPPVEWGVWAPGPAAPIPGSAAIAPGPRGERSSRVPTV